MVTHVYTSLDLGDLGTHEALVIGDVQWVRTGPPGSDEGHYVVRIERVTTSVQLGQSVSVLNVTRILTSSARTDLEEELEAARKRADAGRPEELDSAE